MYHINSGEQGYLDLLQHILDNGIDKEDRTGTGTRSIFGAQLRFDLSKGFPMLTTKRVWSKGVFSELAWLISGSTNVHPMLREGVDIWNEWADDNGDLGPVYGKQWRAWEAPGGREIDQLNSVLRTLLNNPSSRRIIVNAWNPADVDKMQLPPCHAFFQFEVHDNKVSCHLYQRSADVFLGVPFNIASYAALTHVMVELCNSVLRLRNGSRKTDEHKALYEVGDLIMSFGDVHIYNNHRDQVNEQLSRTPRPLPKLYIKFPEETRDRDEKLFPYGLSDIKTEVFQLVNYQPHPAIKAEVSV